MSEELLRCPNCDRKLYHRKVGYVCKNWRCDNHWKMGEGVVFHLNEKGKNMRIKYLKKQIENQRVLDKTEVDTDE